MPNRRGILAGRGSHCPKLPPLLSRWYRRWFEKEHCPKSDRSLALRRPPERKAFCATQMTRELAGETPLGKYLDQAPMRSWEQARSYSIAACPAEWEKGVACMSSSAHSPDTAHECSPMHRGLHPLKSKMEDYTIVCQQSILTHSPSTIDLLTANSIACSR